eukprot:scaffold1237_cov243-Pinguiococcus_pyrenoidosus.AAC.22
MPCCGVFFGARSGVSSRRRPKSGSEGCAILACFGKDKVGWKLKTALIGKRPVERKIEAASLVYGRFCGIPKASLVTDGETLR